MRIKEKNTFVKETINPNFLLLLKKIEKNSSFLMALDVDPKTPSFKSYCSFLTLWNGVTHCRIFVGSLFLRIRLSVVKKLEFAAKDRFIG